MPRSQVASCASSMSYVDTRHREEKTIHCEEAVIIRIKDHFGHAWSVQYGRIFFTKKNIVNLGGDHSSMSHIAPGTACEVWATQNAPGLHSLQDEAGYVDIHWKATNLELKKHRSIHVKEGCGKVTRAHAGFGFLDSPAFDLTLFVPGFAASNNLPLEGAGQQMPDLEGKIVHFLAIPNPKHKFRNFFVIALHRHALELCGPTEDGDQPRSTPGEHWISNTDSARAGDVAGSGALSCAASTCASAANAAARVYQIGEGSGNPSEIVGLHPDSALLAATKFPRLNDLFSAYDALVPAPIPSDVSTQRRTRCEDACVVRADRLFAFLWSPTYFNIYVEPRAYPSGRLCDLVVGQQVTATVVKSPTGRLHATYIIATQNRSPHALDSFGRLTVDVGCGRIFDDCNREFFVPCWVLMKLTDKYTESIDDIEGQRMHFMWVEQTQFMKKVCVIAAHAIMSDGSCALSSTRSSPTSPNRASPVVASSSAITPSSPEQPGKSMDTLKHWRPIDNEQMKNDKKTTTAASFHLDALRQLAAAMNDESNGNRKEVTKNDKKQADAPSAGSSQQEVCVFVVTVDANMVVLRMCPNESLPASVQLATDESLVLCAQTALPIGLQLKMLVPGSQLLAVVLPLAEPLPIWPCDHGNVCAHWYASSVRPFDDATQRIEKNEYWPDEIYEGLGHVVHMMFRGGQFGELSSVDNDGKEHLCLVPNWAFDNNLHPDAPKRTMPELLRVEGVHFMSMPALDRLGVRRVVLSMHEYTDQCTSDSSPAHWIHPHAPMNDPEFKPSFSRLPSRAASRNELCDLLCSHSRPALTLGQQLIDRCSGFLDWVYFDETPTPADGSAQMTEMLRQYRIYYDIMNNDNEDKE